jgi:hypothetical protein
MADDAAADDAIPASVRDGVQEKIEELLLLLTPAEHYIDPEDKKTLVYGLTQEQMEINRLVRNEHDWEQYRNAFLQEVGLGYLFMDVEGQWEDWKDNQGKETMAVKKKMLTFLTLTTALGTTLHFDLRAWMAAALPADFKRGKPAEILQQVLPKDIMALFNNTHIQGHRKLRDVVFVGAGVEEDLRKLFPGSLQNRWLDAKLLFDGLVQRGRFLVTPSKMCSR